MPEVEAPLDLGPTVCRVRPARGQRRFARQRGLALITHRLCYERTFEDLPEHLLKDLTNVWEATLKAMHWRERALTEMGRALATGCTPEHLAAVTGFDVEVVKRLLRRPRQEFNGRHPTDPTAPDRKGSGRGPTHPPGRDTWAASI